MCSIKNEKELTEAIQENMDTIEIESDLTKTLKIKAAGGVGVLNKLGNYDIEKISENRVRLIRK